MIHRDELLDLFDMVATEQAEKGSKVLVFVDEINAKLDGSHVYGAFLSPTEAGYYMRRGTKCNLKPCIWIFAGTEFEDDKLEKGEKLSDFKSRITMIEKIDYKSLQFKYGDLRESELKDEARLEQVYLGASMIHDIFSDVREVSQDVLNLFYQLDPEEVPAREIRKLVLSLQNVQYGRVNKKNCNSPEWEKEKEDLGLDWDETEEAEEKFVKLYFA